MKKKRCEIFVIDKKFDLGLSACCNRPAQQWTILAGRTLKFTEPVVSVG